MTREEQEIRHDLRRMMEKQDKLETNLVGVNRYIGILKKELGELICEVENI